MAKQHLPADPPMPGLRKNPRPLLAQWTPVRLSPDELNAAIALEIWVEERGDRAMASSLLDEYADDSFGWLVHVRRLAEIQ